MVDESIILVAEDDDDDFMLLSSAFKEVQIENPIIRLLNGEEVLDYIFRRGDFANRSKYHIPKLLLLDLNMPKKSGYEALREIRSDSRFTLMPIVVLSTSSVDSSINDCYRYGASAYMVKPNSYQGLLEISRAFKTFWLDHSDDHLSAERTAGFDILR